MTNTSRFVWGCFVAELLGTFLLVVIGDGAIASYVVTKQKIDVFCTCLAFGVGAMIATFAGAKISGAHINPAASVAFALNGQLSWRLVPVYLCAQYLGGFLGALVLAVNYGEAINAMDSGTHIAFGGINATGHIFATYPGEWVSVWGSLLDQIIGTGVLLFSLSAVGDKRNLGLEDKHQPLIVAFIIGLVCVAFSANCGAIFNPARDFAPRLLTFVFGYQGAFQPIQGLYWLTAGLIGPHVGAIIGVFAYRTLIGRSLEYKQDYEMELAERCKQHQRSLTSKYSSVVSSHQQNTHNQQPIGRASVNESEMSTHQLGSSDNNYGSSALRR